MSLTKGYFGHFQAYFGQFKGYSFAVLGHFCCLLRLGGFGSQGLYNRSKSRVTSQIAITMCARIIIGDNKIPYLTFTPGDLF